MRRDSRMARFAKRAAETMSALAAPLEARGVIRTMAPELRAAFAREMASAEEAFARGDDAAAMDHFGRGHLLGSYFCFSHFLSHVGMLRVGMRRRDAREMRVQALRVVGTIGTRLFVPFFGITGNPGSADRPVGSRYPLPVDIAELLAKQSFPVWGRAKHVSVPTPVTSS